MVRILSASSAGIDSRYPKIFRDRGELRINLCVVLRDRDLLILDFLGDREDLLFLLLAQAWSFGPGGGHEQGQGEKGGESGKAFHGSKIRSAFFESKSYSVRGLASSKAFHEGRAAR
jgi:hypothetical protein